MNLGWPWQSNLFLPTCFCFKLKLSFSAIKILSLSLSFFISAKLLSFQSPSSTSCFIFPPHACLHLPLHQILFQSNSPSSASFSSFRSSDSLLSFFLLPLLFFFWTPPSSFFNSASGPTSFYLLLLSISISGPLFFSSNSDFLAQSLSGPFLSISPSRSLLF